MMKASLNDESDVVRILSLAFNDNLSVMLITGNKAEGRFQRIQSLMQYAFRSCIAQGEVWISEDRQACALIQFPASTSNRLVAMLRDLKLIYRVIGIKSIRRILQREELIKSLHPEKPFYYLWFIGVNPSAQGHGIGSQMLKSICQQASSKHQDIYLESSTYRNLEWYRAMGFEEYQVLDLEYPLHCFRKTN